MKYQALHEFAKTEREHHLFWALKGYPDVINTYQTGYGVFSKTFGVVNVYDTEGFDVLVTKLLSSGAEVALFSKTGDRIWIEVWFVTRNKDIAVGYAMGKGQDQFYDIAQKRYVNLRG